MKLKFGVLRWNNLSIWNSSSIKPEPEPDKKKNRGRRRFADLNKNRGRGKRSGASKNRGRRSGWRRTDAGWKIWSLDLQRRRRTNKRWVGDLAEGEQTLGGEEEEEGK